MPVAASAFRRWATAAALPGNTAALARAIGVARPTLQKQLIRGRVQEAVVVAASRAIASNPIEALSSFTEYADLMDGTRPPLLTEVLSQVTLDDLLLELMRRRQPANARTLAAMHDWPAPPLADGLRRWIDAVDPGDLRRALAERLAVATTNLSTQITTNKLGPAALVEAARIANTSLVSGLAVGGLVTLEEAGWALAARQHTVLQLHDSALLDLIASRVSAAQRTARRVDAEEVAARRIQDALG